MGESVDPDKEQEKLDDLMIGLLLTAAGYHSKDKEDECKEDE